MVDVAGLELTDEERDFLKNPLVGAVILFSRNYANPAQLRALTADIRRLRDPQLLIAVDHEGGRVQRFRDGFTAVPPMRVLGQAWERNREEGLELARAAGQIIGCELAASGVDFSFTPVLDIDYGASAVIGDRALSRQPETIAALAGALMQGLADAGMAAVGKHFPGHGYAAADSHVAIPVDDREWQDIEREDIAPYRALIPQGLAAIMPAHVIYPRVDPQPAGFSAFWIREVLRRRLGFDGLVFSDDLSMEGASVAGDMPSRARAAFAADCDMVLVCNAPDAARQLVQALGADSHRPALRAERAARMRGQPGPAGTASYRAALELLQSRRA
jgi:beta-N-acetylhexosaminidase